MSLQQRVYSVLVVSAAEKFNSTFNEMLPESKFSPVKICNGVSSAKRAFAERQYDFVIINSPLPDDAGLRFSIDVCASKSSVVLVLVRNDILDEVSDNLKGHGAFLLAKPTSKGSLTMALDFMTSAREILRGFEKKTLSIEEKMEEIRIVNRAKWILIDELKMDEPNAHRYIEKQAMDRCVSKRVVAEEIIKTYHL